MPRPLRLPRLPRPAIRRPSWWAVLVPVVALAAGLLFATSGQTALGTDLRAGESSQLSTVIEQRNRAVAAQQDELAALQQREQQLTDEAAGRDGEVAAAQRRSDALADAAGLTEVRGAGLEITLDDAPQTANGLLPPGASVDDLVIHQSDVQAVVNAMWAAGAPGVAVMGKRLVATSAVRCVGNTLLLQGRTYSPPFVITAVGDGGAIRDQLSRSQDITYLQQAVDALGLTYRLTDQPDVVVPAYDGALDVQYATAG